jgi:hypothetical protein
LEAKEAERAKEEERAKLAREELAREELAREALQKEQKETAVSTSDRLETGGSDDDEQADEKSSVQSR